MFAGKRRRACESGERITAAKAVICSTRTSSYDGLLKDWPISEPAEVRRGLEAFRHGKGDMQIHYALKGPARWRGDPDFPKVALIHLTSGLERHVTRRERGGTRSSSGGATICVGQPTALDPSRAPPGAAILWLQMPEASRFVKGDAARRDRGDRKRPVDQGHAQVLRRPHRATARRAYRELGRNQSLAAPTRRPISRR